MKFASLKKILRQIKRWRYKHLYRKLFMLYANKFDYAYYAAKEAETAFNWLTGEKWDNWL
ncbi:MAG: hypothetical protein HDR99_05825 [Bacteroides sp.]|nr:hypothetical protein [Bacteroides sp.]